MLLCKAGANCLMTNAENKTPKELADMATQNETVAYLELIFPLLFKLESF